MSSLSIHPAGHPGQRLPNGTVTFLFTDIEGSTQLLGRLPVQPLKGSENPALEVANFPQGTGRVVVPSGWVQEPATQAVCAELSGAEAGLALRHSAKVSLASAPSRGSTPSIPASTS